MVLPAAAAPPFLREGGETGALLRAFDWQAHPLGPPAGWPQSLKTAVSLMLRARQPMFIGWGPDLISIYNDGYLPICGSKHPGALGKPMASVWPEIWDRLGPLNDEVLRGESLWFENRPFQLAGRQSDATSYFSFSYTPLLDDDGRIGGLFCSAVETTATVSQAQQTDDEVVRLQRLFEQAPGFICTLRGPEHVYEFINDAHRRLFQRPDIVGKTVREAFPDVADQGFFELLDKVYRSGERHVAHDVRMRLRDAPGGAEREIVIDFIFAPVLDASGAVCGIFCEGNDVTGVREAQHALLEKEEQLRLATDAAEIGMWDVDMATGAMFWPPRVRAMFGITSDEPLTLQAFYDHVHPDDRDATVAAFQAACDPALRTVYDVEYRTVGRDDGRVRWVAAKGRGLFDADGVCTRVLGAAIDVSHRKATELAMEMALEASRTGTFHWNIQANTLHWDAALDRLFGLPPGQVVRSLEQFVARVHPDDRAEVIARCERCRDEAADFDMEFRVVHPDGSIHWLYDRGRTFVDGEGRAKTMTGACVDVTQRRVAETALRSSEEFYRRTLESVPGITYTATADGACNYLSAQWTRYTGQDAGAALGTGWLQALHPDDRAATTVVWRQSVQHGTPFAAEFRLRRHDGRHEWFQSHGTAISATADAPARWIGSLNNVHELKLAQAALQDRERALRALADNSPDIIARFDRQLRHVFVNAAIERLTGLPNEAFIGRTNEELGMPQALCAQWNDAIRSVFATGRPAEVQFEQELEGVHRHLLSRLVPESAPDGSVEHVLGVTRDITDLWQAQQALQRADRQKDDFLATLAHELRNPLAPLRTGLEVLKRGEGRGDLQRVRDIMDRQLNHMVRLVDELLDIARISQGKIVLQRATLPLQAVLDQAVEAARPLLDAHRHHLRREDASPSWHVDGDATRLVQVVGNLLNNAAKYTPDGGEISLRAREEGHGVAIVVQDNGIGIPKEHLGRVFERFVQVEDHAERAQGGLGIGLSVVRSLVEMHGGRVSVESSGPGRGSRFAVWLPRVPAPAAQARQGVDLLRAVPMAARKILIVDDNQDAAETLAMIVGLSGHEVHLAHDGVAAVQMAQRHEPDVVFLDIGMPGMNGYEAAARLRALPGGQDRMLVALTGWGAEEDRARSLRAGFDVHLTKPVDVQAVETLLAQDARRAR